MRSKSLKVSPRDELIRELREVFGDERVTRTCSPRRNAGKNHDESREPGGLTARFTVWLAKAHLSGASGAVQPHRDAGARPTP